jgi:hypothetical protein
MGGSAMGYRKSPLFSAILLSMALIVSGATLPRTLFAQSPTAVYYQYLTASIANRSTQKLSGSTVVPLPQGAGYVFVLESGHFEGHASSVNVFPPTATGVSASMVAGVNRVEVTLVVAADAMPGPREINIFYPTGNPGKFNITIVPDVRITNWHETGSPGDGWVRQTQVSHGGTGLYTAVGRYTYPSCEPGSYRVPIVMGGRNLNSPGLKLTCNNCSLHPQLAWQGTSLSPDSWSGHISVTADHHRKSFDWVATNTLDTYGLRDDSRLNLGMILDDRCETKLRDPGSRTERSGSEPVDPPRVTLTAPRELRPGSGASCVGPAGADGPFAATNQYVVPLSWSPDPAAFEVNNSGAWKLEYEVELRNVTRGASCPSFSAFATSDPGACAQARVNSESHAPNVYAGEKYQWRVRSAIMAAGASVNHEPVDRGPWTNWQDFTAAPLLTAPILKSPANNYVVSSPNAQSVTLDWHPAACTNSGYRVEILFTTDVNTPPSPQNPIDVAAGSTSASLMLSQNGFYYWRVLTKSGSAQSDWSQQQWRIRKTN